MKFFLVSLFLLAMSAFAEEEHGHEDARFGPKKGVMAVSDELGFKLNDAASKNFAIKTAALGAKPWKVPRKAVAYSREETHVFRLREGHYKSADIKIIKREGDQLTIDSKDLKDGDQIAIEGAAFLTIVNEAVFGAELSHEH